MIIEALISFNRAFCFSVQEVGASSCWESQRLIGRNCDGHLSQQEVNKADATIAHLEHAVCGGSSSRIPQLDGIEDNYDDSVAEEDYNELGEEGKYHCCYCHFVFLHALLTISWYM
jgi:hypothetical protein